MIPGPGQPRPTPGPATTPIPSGCMAALTPGSRVLVTVPAGHDEPGTVIDVLTDLHGQVSSYAWRPAAADQPGHPWAGNPNHALVSPANAVRPTPAAPRARAAGASNPTSGAPGSIRVTRSGAVTTIHDPELGALHARSEMFDAALARPAAELHAILTRHGTDIPNRPGTPLVTLVALVAIHAPSASALINGIPPAVRTQTVATEPATPAVGP